MRWASVVREAWRNVTSGTARSGLIAAVLVVLAVMLQLADLLTVQSLVERVREFRAAGADILVYTSTGRVDGTRCELLAQQPNVLAVGAVRRGVDRFAAALPASSIPAFDVTPGFPAVLGADGDRRPGVVVSRELADTLSLGQGDALQLLDGKATVAAVYAYPEDGRTTGYGYALLMPGADRQPFDACWVREWPRTEMTEQLLRGVGTAAAVPDDAPAPELTQLNSSLGRSLDAAASFQGRATRLAPLVALLVAGAACFGITRMRRLELASARHLGVRASAQVLGVVLESVAWALPVGLAGLLTAAWVAADGRVGAVPVVLGLGALAPIATVIGGTLGAAAAAATIRERNLLRYLKER